MKKVLLIDAFSTVHVGNGALLENTHKLVKKFISDDIDVLSIDPSPNQEYFENVYEDFFSGYGGSGWQKLSFAIGVFWFFIIEVINVKLLGSYLRLPWGQGKRRFLELVDRSDICVSLSGETINDYYYPHMYLRLLTYWLAIMKGKKFIVFPQSIGPITRSFSKVFLRQSLGKAAFIIARDEQSFALAKELWVGCNVSILFSPDVAVTQYSEKVSIKRKTTLPLIGFTISDIPRKEMGFEGDYVSQIVEEFMAAFSAISYEVILMPSNYKHVGYSGDYVVSMDVMNRLRENGYQVDILENRLYYPAEYQGMQKDLFAFVSTRMHVGILATSAGIPTVMINTQHKIRSYMQLMNMEDCVVELHAIKSQLSMKLLNLSEKNGELRDTLSKNNQKLRMMVEQTLSDVCRGL